MHASLGPGVTAGISARLGNRAPLRVSCGRRAPPPAGATKPGDRTPTSTPVGGGEKPSGDDVGVGLKATWYAAEAFGKLVGGKKDSGDDKGGDASAGPKMTREEIIASMRDDYAEDYFVSGKGKMAAYAEDCVFADPFVSFSGTDRFKQNVGNLGGLMRDINLDVYDWNEEGDAVNTKWRFSCILDLPWRPRLAAAGGTTHIIDATSGKVVKHIENWEIEPSKVVSQLFKPSAKIPTTAAETFFMSASNGDFKGMWFGASPLLLKLSFPVVLVSLVCKLATGDGLPGLGGVELAAYIAVASCSATEVIKFVDGTFGK